jgi:exoribonuclease R
VYMPDERISMFPSVLSTELLSLGAAEDSYALSCGVTLNDSGEC